ncbi:MAG: hypothetical protein UV89_C0024G0001, partial [candidate division WWE3 bacterium GW2011_GWB2_43_22]
MKQNNNLTFILGWISKAIPLYLLPFTILLAMLWAVRLMTGQKIELAKSIIDFPLVVFTSVYALATVFSMNKTVSIFGSQGRWLGLFSLVVFVIYYYIATPLYRNPKAIRTAVYAFLTGTGIATFVSLLSYFNIFISSATYMKLQNFSFYGGTTQTAMFASLSIVMALVLIAYEKNMLIKIGLVGATILSILYVALTGALAAWALL